MKAIDDVYVMPHLAAILVSGVDADRFLQSQLSSNVAVLEAGAVQLASWCAANGRVIGLGWLFRTSAGFCWIVAADMAEALVFGLNKYKLRAKVIISLSGTTVFGFDGNLSATTSNAVVAPVDSVQLADGRHVGCGVVTRCAGAPDDFLARWLQRDIELKIPWNGGGEHFLPQVLGIERFAGLSLKKGCFPGQEVISRLHYKGVLKRGLRVLQFAEPIALGRFLCSDTSDEIAIIQAQGLSALAVVNNNLSRNFSIQIKGYDEIVHDVDAESVDAP